MSDNFIENNLEFVLYDLFDKDHLDFIREFEEDELLYGYYDDWKDILKSYIKNSPEEHILVYLVKTNKTFIGLCTLVFDDYDNVVYKQGILSSFQKENDKLVREAMLQKMKEEQIEKIVEYFYVFDYKGVEELIKEYKDVNNIGDTGFYEVVHYDALKLEK